MPVQIDKATAITITSASPVVLVAEITELADQIVGLAIGNVSLAKTTISIHVIDTAATPPLDDTDQFNAFAGWYEREIGPREEGVVMSIPISTGNKITAQAGVDDAIVIHVFPVNA